MMGSTGTATTAAARPPTGDGGGGGIIIWEPGKFEFIIQIDVPFNFLSSRRGLNSPVPVLALVLD